MKSLLFLFQANRILRDIDWPPAQTLASDIEEYLQTTHEHHEDCWKEGEAHYLCALKRILDRRAD